VVILWIITTRTPTSNQKEQLKKKLYRIGLPEQQDQFAGSFFDARTTDQTLPVQISSATGYTGALLNTGAMQNRGYELDLKVSPSLKLTVV
jgi:hypothetical protein